MCMEMWQYFTVQSMRSFSSGPVMHLSHTTCCAELRPGPRLHSLSSTPAAASVCSSGSQHCVCSEWCLFLRKFFPKLLKSGACKAGAGVHFCNVWGGTHCRWKFKKLWLLSHVLVKGQAVWEASLRTDHFILGWFYISFNPGTLLQTCTVSRGCKVPQCSPASCCLCLRLGR